ncbi:MAG TPA: glycosyltransferase family 2 protein [Patescibacteria group bacterium]|nr:glycosyltransferase family 2 protein [Patescibacteria group bacterium]
MTVSVVIPAFNEEQYLKRCLQSIFTQEIAPDEVIAVNNNSTDKTVSIAQQFPVRIIYETQQGMIQARNRGFNEATSEIIARTDADTRVPRDWIKKIKQHFEDERVVAVSGTATTYDAINNLSKHAMLQTLKSYTVIMRKVLGHDCMIGPNMAIRATTWEKIKNSVCLNNNDVHEDIDLSIHLAAFGKIIFDKTLVVNSSSRRFKKFESYIEYPYRVVKSVRKHKKFFMEQKGKEFLKKILHSFPLTLR